MGGLFSSVETITNNINKNITNLTINSIQSSSSTIDQSQTLNINCTEWVKESTVAKMACVKEIPDLIKSGMSPEKAAEVCKIYDFGCSANNINMKGVMQNNINDDMILKIQTYLANNIKSAIDNAASQSGGISIGSTVVSSVGAEIDNIQNVIQTYLQTDFTNINGTQTIMINNAPASFITQDIFSDNFKTYTASNTVYTSSVNEIASAIKNASSQNFGGGSIITIIIVIILILIIFGIIYWIWQKRSSKKSSEPPKLSSSEAPTALSSKFRNR